MTKEHKSTGIKSWPLDDRPREKLLKKGAGVDTSSYKGILDSTRKVIKAAEATRAQ